MFQLQTSLFWASSPGSVEAGVVPPANVITDLIIVEACKWGLVTAKERTNAYLSTERFSRH